MESKPAGFPVRKGNPAGCPVWAGKGNFLMFCPAIRNHPIKKSAANAKQCLSHPVPPQILEAIGLLFPLCGLLAALIAVLKKSTKILCIAKAAAIAGCAWSFWQLADAILNGQK